MRQNVTVLRQFYEMFYLWITTYNVAMNKDTIRKILNDERLKDIPLLYVIKIISVILECEYDNKNRPKRNRPSRIDEVSITIQ